MKLNLNLILSFLHSFTGKWMRWVLCGCLSAAVLITLAPASQAASGTSQSGVSTATVLSIIVGLIITAFYIRGMYLVLHYASETYDVDFDFAASPDANKTRNGIIIGSFLLVIISALIISSYGWASLFLYIGPILCLLGPIVVIVSMEVDLKKYKQVLRRNQLEQQDLALYPAYDAEPDFDSQTNR